MTTQQRDAVETRLRAAGFDPELPIEQRRESFALGFGSRPLPAGTVAEPAVLGDRPALRLTPPGARQDAALLYLHGGGYVVGSAETGRFLAATLGRRVNVPALALDYRLAPEHPYPAAVEDAVAAYRALLDSGLPGNRIVLAGDSAGGGLAVALLQAARDAGLPQPAGAVLFSPFTDLAVTGASTQSRADVDPLFTAAVLQYFADTYLDGADAHAPHASPIYGDLAGLGPLLVQVGTHELLLDDAIRLADRAVDAGVAVTLDVVAGMPHVFQSNEGLLDEADAALDRAGAFLRDALGG